VNRPVVPSGSPVGTRRRAARPRQPVPPVDAPTGQPGTLFRKGLPRVPEKVIQAQCVRLLRSLGGLVWTLGTSRRAGDYHGTMQTPGLPDVIFAIRGRMGMLECKAAGGKLRPEQAVFRQACADCGVHHITGGVEELFAWLVAEGIVLPDNVPHGRRRPCAK